MIPVLTKEQAYKLDEDTIKSGHLSQEQLMDNAGKIVAQFFCEKIDNPFNQKVVVVCGKGNNGGDGVIAHSYLKLYNISSKIIFTNVRHGHAKLLKKYNIFKNEYSIYNNKTKFDKYDWIIDGIFGIGLSRDLNGKYQKIVKVLNKNKNIISIDISSGLLTNSNNSKKFINSKYVISLGYPKLGHYLSPVNDLYCLNIGFKEISSNIEKIECSDIYKILKSYKVKKNLHKYSKGTVHITAGSHHYPGAAILSSKAAKITGAGYVRLHIDRSLFFINDCKNKDNSIEYEEGIINIGEFHKKFILELQSELKEIIVDDEYQIESKSSNLFGPGVTSRYVKGWSYKRTHILDLPKCVIDAGGFLSFKKIQDYPKYSILTPHVGEFQSIFNLGNDFNLNASLFLSIQKKIKSKIIILKSFNTFIITKDMIYIMDRGPSILATAGTGDVLSGILVSLLSQGYSRLDASILGTYLHAEAASYYMNNISKDGMTASDLIDCIPYAFNNLRNNEK